MNDTSQTGRPTGRETNSAPIDSVPVESSAVTLRSRTPLAAYMSFELVGGSHLCKSTTLPLKPSDCCVVDGHGGGTGVVGSTAVEPSRPTFLRPNRPMEPSTNRPTMNRIIPHAPRATRTCTVNLSTGSSSLEKTVPIIANRRKSIPALINTAAADIYPAPWPAPLTLGSCPVRGHFSLPMSVGAAIRSGPLIFARPAACGLALGRQSR